MAITPPWALQVGARNCFNRPIAICMATIATADDTFLTFTALDGQVSLSASIPPTPPSPGQTSTMVDAAPATGH
jgi:hypothetical protein